MQPNRSRRSIRRDDRRDDRSAFTIIELLVVVTIIAVLMAVSIKVYGALVGQARESATRLTLAKIQGLMDARAQAFQRRYEKGYVVTGSVERQQLASRMFPANPQAADVATRKLLEAKWFPQAAADLLDPGIVVNGQIIRRGMHSLYPNLVDATGALVNPAVTPAEILYDFLTQEATLGNPPMGVDAFTAAEVADTNLNGLPEFIDGWGNPIRFYRWPTRLFRPAGQTPGTAIAPLLTDADLANAKTIISVLPSNVPISNSSSDLGRDQDDPLRTLWAATQATTLEKMTFPGTSITGPTPSTWWTWLAVSAGPDGRFGMFPPDDVANFGNLAAVHDADALADDIVSICMKASGR